MKHIITILAIAAILIVVFTFSNVAAQSSQPGATTVVTVTPFPQGKSMPVNSAPSGWGMGMHGGRMAGGPGRMQGRMGMMNGNMLGGPGMVTEHMGITAGGGFNMNHETMGMGVTQMQDDVSWYLGLRSQDLYIQMASGKSLVEIAAEKGITEQQLIDSVMTGRRVAFDQAVKAGYMTRIYADSMLQNLNSNLKLMVTDHGYGSSGWSMMWETPFTP